MFIQHFSYLLILSVISEANIIENYATLCLYIEEMITNGYINELDHKNIEQLNNLIFEKKDDAVKKEVKEKKGLFGK